MNPIQLGQTIRDTRKQFKLTQAELAMVAGTAPRFISDLENGKPSCHLGKSLDVLKALGIKVILSAPEKGEPS